MPPPGDRRALVLALAWILALTVALYGRTLGFEYTGTDDVTLIRDDAVFLGDATNLLAAFRRPLFRPGGAGEVYYRPVVAVTYILDAQWRSGGLTAFHATNVVLHAVASLLFFLVLRGMAIGAWPALAATSILVVHPALAETTAWIPGRTDSLLAVWVFGALLALRRFVARGSVGALAGHAALTALALFTKEAAIALPALYVADVVLVAQRREALRDRRLWIAWGAAGALWLVVRAAAHLPDAHQTIEDRLAVTFAHLHVVLMHLGKLVFPYKLSVLATADDTPWIPGAVAAGVLAVGASRLDGRPRRLFAWGAICFFVFILPALPVSDYLILENRLYVPAAGVLIALLAIASPLLARPRAVLALAATACLTTAVLAIQTYRYTEGFRDRAAFTAAAVLGSPRSALAHLNRGIALHDTDLDAAEREYQAALRCSERQPVLHNNLGLVYLSRGDVDRAEREFRREIEIDPGYDKAHYNLGLALERRGRAADARASFRQALALNPENSAAAERSRAAVAGAPAHEPPAELLVELYEGALAKDPTNLAIRRHYAELCAQHKLSCARTQYEIVLRDAPGDEEAIRALKDL